MLLINQLDEESSRTLVRRGKVFSILYTFTVYTFVTLLLVNDCSVAEDFWHSLIAVTHFLIFIHVGRIGPNDIFVLYIYVFIGCRVVMEHLTQLRLAVNQYEQFTQPMFFILEKYSRLITSISQLNSLSRFLILLSKLLVYPIASTVIFISTAPSNGLMPRLHCTYFSRGGD